jgi:glucose/arabinose dehydrogenase
MKTLLLCFFLLVLPACCLGDDADKPGDIAITENGTTLIAANGRIYEGLHGADNMKSHELSAHVLRAWKNFVFLANKNEYWQRDPKGAYKKLFDQEAITKLVGSPATIQTFIVDSNGNQFIAVENDAKQTALLRRNAGGKLSIELNFNQVPEFTNITSLVSSGETALLAHSTKGDTTYILCLLQKKMIGTLPMGPVKSLVYDNFGRLYGINTKDNLLMVLNSPHGTAKAVHKTKRPEPGKTYNKEESTTIQSSTAEGIAINPITNNIVLLNTKNSNGIAQLFFQLGDPTHPVNETPLPFTVAPAFPNIEWTGWEPVNDKGIAVPLRPVLLTHAGDGSNRIFVGTQHGVIHVFPNKPDVKQTKVFLDIQKLVNYNDNKNEEGLLGLAFHPDYKKNGEFFVYYTKKPGLLSVISRFKVSRDDPNRADPASEEVLLSIKQPMWNHNGGTLAFGHDGYLYIAMGDGGGANDMFKNSRKMNTLLSKVLRIDINTKSDGKAYGIPKDNPFLSNKDACPEIYCYGIRNIWRLVFDRKTGQGWFGEVGQNLYEEINLLEKGADYGWNVRESFHPFGAAGVAANDKMVEPIWEYHHDIGKSITGGHVYRGKTLPELDGKYFYADYVSAKIWALTYDFDKKRVVGNQEIGNRGLPIMSFGEDEEGEIYLLTFSAQGQGIDRIVRKK